MKSKLFYLIDKLINSFLILIVGVYWTYFLFQFKDISYASDDFCKAADLKNFGLFGFIKKNYLGWDGRYSTNFILGVIYSLPRNLQNIFIFLIFVLFLFLLNKIFTKVIPNLLKRIIFIGIVLAYLFLSLQLEHFIFNPTLFVTYFFPILLLNFVTFLIFLKRSDLKVSVLIAITSFFLAGFHENLMLLLIFIAVFLTIFSFFTKTFYIYRQKLIIATFSLIIGGLIMFLAPGNKVRQSYFVPFPIFKSLVLAFLSNLNYFNFEWFINFIKEIFFSTLLFFLINPKIIGEKKIIKISTFYYLFVISLWLISFLTLFQGYFSVGNILGGRQILFLKLFEKITIILSGYIFYLLLINKFKNNYFVYNLKIVSFIIFLSFFGLNFFEFKNFVTQLNFYSTYEKKLFATEIKSVKKIFIPDHPFYLEQISSDKKNWSNICLRDYLKNEKLLIIKPKD
jgi:hypothetical protein